MKIESTRRQIEDAAHKVRDFNRKPPTWFYWVAFIVIVFAAQLIRVSFR